MPSVEHYISAASPELLDADGQLNPGISAELLYDLILLCPDAIIGSDRHGRIFIFNRAAERLLGLSASEVIDRHSAAGLYGSLEQARRIKSYIYSNEFGGRGRLVGFECQIVDACGRDIPIRLSASLLHRNNREVGCVGFFHDTTRRRKLEAELRNLSIRDCLSGLYNHRHFYTRLNEELARCRRHDGTPSLLCIDLDNFKQFNDQFGHLEGDEVIRLVGRSLRESIRDIDMAFRYGGDEFMVLLPRTTPVEARACGQRIRRHFEAHWPYAEHCGIHGIKPITMSIGITAARPEDQAQALVQRADNAMYVAKRAGGDRISQ